MDETETQLMQIFMPYAVARVSQLRARNGRFVHYTSAENAFKIISSSQVWMRNVHGMVDFMEVEHGFALLTDFFAVADQRKAFIESLNACHDGVAEEALKLFDGWLPEIRSSTYIACLSEHDDSEDEFGRLSMWRATAQRSPRVALVVNSAPFMATSDALKAYSSPVSYLTGSAFNHELLGIIGSIRGNATLLAGLPRARVVTSVFNMLLFACTCSKHPGFFEEREWRVLYVPRQHQSKVITESIEMIEGVPQIVCKIPLKDIPSEGLVGIEIPSFLNRLIIGPSAFPGPLYQAFHRALSDAGVKEPDAKIVISNIPLRS